MKHIKVESWTTQGFTEVVREGFFRPRRACIDLIFIIQMLIEESNEWRRNLLILIIDFEKASNSINQETLWKILSHYELPEKIVNLIMAMYKETECCVRTSTGDARWFKITSGVKQGCVLSPLLFIIVFDFTLQNANSKGVRLSNSKQLSDIEFVDNLTLLDKDKASL